MMMQLIFVLFVVFTGIQLCYFLCLFSRFAFIRTAENTEAQTNLPFSVIICAKDEAENLNEFLPHIYQQDYSNFEVVLIDDRSIDNTEEVMESFAEKFPNETRLVKIAFSDNKRFVGNKKYALTLGIKAAKYNHLLFTDADCQPVSKNWIRQMAGRFSSEKQLVLGYGKYQAIARSLLNKLIRYETLQTALQYFSYALAGKAYMGVGRNLAYTKELFMDNNGFYEHLDILSGDDDLFVNQVATRENTDICVDKQGFTISKPETSWASYLYQKRRHIATASHYKWQHKFLLGLYYLSTIGFWITAILLFVSTFQWRIVLGIFLFRWLIWWIINYKTAQKLDEKNLVLFLPILEPVLISFQLLIFVMNLFKKPKFWTH